MAVSKKRSARRSILTLVWAGAIGVWGPVPARGLPAAEPVVYSAAPEPGGRVSLGFATDGGETRLEAWTGRWLAWDLRTPYAAAPDGAFEVREAGGSLPRLRVRADGAVIAVVRSGPEPWSGLLALGPLGVRPLLRAAGMRYRLVPGSAALAPGRAFVTVVLEGAERPEVWGLELTGRVPRAVPVRRAGPADRERVVPSSVAPTAGALFFVTRGPGGNSTLWRAPATRGASGSGALVASPVAGPFTALRLPLARSPGAVAFLAGDDPEALRPYTATSEGPARARTEATFAVAEREGAGPGLAVSSGGEAVAFNRSGPGESTELHVALRDGAGGDRTVHLTADERFAEYIEQDVLILFDADDRLVFAAGHDRSSLDLFRVDPARPASAVNLTGTSGQRVPPFPTTGHLDLRRVVLVGNDRVLVAAAGLAGAGLAARVVDAATGTTRAEVGGLDRVGSVFRAGGALFAAVADPGGRRLLRLDPGGSTSLFAVAGEDPVEVVARHGEAAVVDLPGAGLVELGDGAGPRVLAEGAPGAALVASGPPATLTEARGPGVPQYVVRRRSEGVASGAFEAVDLATEEIRHLPGPAGGLPVAFGLASAPFLRGDADGDGRVTLSDAVRTLGYLFLGGAPLTCPDAADTDDDGELSVSDPVALLVHLFVGGRFLPPPGSSPGLDPTADLLDCARTGS